MPQEIERKFLTTSTAWQSKTNQGTIFKQGYLSTTPERTVRVRIAGDKAWMTIKGKTIGNSRLEFEYEIPVSDAAQLLELCIKPLIEKRRYIVMESGLAWEVDVFHGENEGLIIAEVELESEDQEVVLPDWVGEEVSADARYYNSNLILNPFCTWEE
ncbi:MAG: CYTH domain-containing protein [Saprospiraceae bacterium]